MDSANRSIDIHKRYRVVFDNDPTEIIIEFTEEQEIDESELYFGYGDIDAFECYILDKDNEAETRAIYYYEQYDDYRYMKYTNIDDETIDMKIKTIMPVDYVKPDLTMGDIC